MRVTCGADLLFGGLRLCSSAPRSSRASIDHKTAVDTLAAVSDIRLALVLRKSYGWSLDHIEQWIATTS